MTSIVALIIVLGVLIFFHEFGHFLTARLFGVGVERFSLGFGPRLFGFRSGITDYRVSAVPLGGYVKMVGEDPQEEVEPADREISFTHKPLSQRFLIVAAGPVFNLLLAVIIFFGLFQIAGSIHLKPVIGEVKPDMPAAEAGLSQGDRVLAIDGKKVATWTQMAEKIEKSGGKTLSVTVAREREQITVDLAPRLADSKNIFGESRKRYVVGIVAAGETVREHLGPAAALTKSVGQTWRIVRLTCVGVVKIIAGSLSTKELGGPILIAQMAGEQAEQGAASLLAFIAFISINLAILNFLPIPVLDGGHLLFFIIEAVQGRPVTLKTREIAQQFGMFVIIFLMVLVFYNDIMRLLQ